MLTNDPSASGAGDQDGPGGATATSGARRRQQLPHVVREPARAERLARRDVRGQPAVRVDDPHDRRVGALGIAGDLGRGVPRSPHRRERLLGRLEASLAESRSIAESSFPVRHAAAADGTRRAASTSG